MLDDQENLDQQEQSTEQEPENSAETSGEFSAADEQTEEKKSEDTPAFDPGYTYKSRQKSPFEDAPYIMNHGIPADDQQKPKKKKRGCSLSWLKLTAIILVVALVSSGVTAIFVSLSCRHQLKLMHKSLDEKIASLEELRREPAAPVPSEKPAPQGVLTPGQVYDMNAKTVVSIVSAVKEEGRFGKETLMESSGSGFIVSEDGYVVTNCHVVEDATTVRVRDHDGNEYDAKIIGKDAGNDIALLKVEAENLHPVKFGSSTDLAVGEQVVAIGHPLGNQNAILTVGYVSAKDQVVQTDGTSLDMLQTDAAINAGNSGGPLFDSRGNLVGITTAKYSGYTASGASIEGVGYAIPVDDIVSLLKDLKEFGKVKRAYLGIYVKNVAPDAQEYGIPAGAFVEDTMKGLAAEKSGIKAKDVIVDMGGYPVTSVADLTRALQKFQAGDEVVTKVWRNGEYTLVNVLLEEMPEEPVEKPTEPDASQEEPDYSQLPDDPREWFEFFDHFFGN